MYNVHDTINIKLTTIVWPSKRIHWYQRHIITQLQWIHFLTNTPC